MLGHLGISRKRFWVQLGTLVRGLRLPEWNRMRPTCRKAATEIQAEIRGSIRGPEIGGHLGGQIWPKTRRRFPVRANHLFQAPGQLKCLALELTRDEGAPSMHTTLSGSCAQIKISVPLDGAES